METDEKLCNNVIEMANTKSTNLENNLIKSECLKRTLDGLVNDIKDEKVDVSPEISNKSPNSNGDIEKSVGGMNKSFSMYASFGGNSENEEIRESTENPSKTIDASKSTAFVIDFSGGKQIDEQRHKNLLERFQSRHKRGVSLSKVEDEMNDSSSSSQLTAKLKSPATSAKTPRKLSASSSTETTTNPPTQQKPSSGGVRLRDRSKASQVRDTSKRHSWSPRTSMVESTNNTQLHSQSKQTKSGNKFVANPLERPLKLHALSKADVKPMPPTSLNISTLQCLPTPLVNRESHLPQDDQVSEAGTYTLDGDNYTEEQKEKMNIDKYNCLKDVELLQTKLVINESDSNVETDLEVIDLDLDPSPTQHPTVRQAKINANRKNILEVSFYHQEQPSTSSVKSKTSYLEKLKTKVKSSLHKSKSPESSDVGTFTSVTTSGVLSVKPTLEINPKLKRKNSLTKSHIDSSEYVQGRLNKADVKGPITDNDKSSITSAYRLNIFSNKQSSPAKSRKESVGSSNTSISTAATKDDWIQEWARNAREHSLSKRAQATNSIMSSSFNVESSRESRDNQFGYFGDDVMSKSDCKPHYEEFGDNLEKYHQKNQHQKKSNDANNLSSNQSSVSSARGRKILREFDPNKDDPRFMSSNFNIKPPISPCRIPSPIGSVSHRKKRYGSNAMLYGSETDLTNDTDLYLQRTAAAISTLQNLQRKNSIRNSSLQNSPASPLSPTRPPIVQSNKITSTEQTPSLRSQSVTRNPIHKRNSSLDSTRFAPSNQLMSTSLQTNYLTQAMATDSKQQQHSRHNSYEGMPHKTSKFAMHFDQTDDDDEYESMPRRSRGSSERPHLLIKQQQQLKQQQHQSSPIKRSSSFNVKPMDMSSPGRGGGATKMNNNFTKTFSAPANGSRIQKSASSSCFKQMAHSADDDEDFDDDIYINDDDDLHPNQFTPSECSEDEQKISIGNVVNEAAPINTRYVNKTFLMRCEQNKKAAGNSNGAGASGGLKAVGAIACPNTPELPRRNLSERSSGRERASAPRDSSLNRVLDKKPLQISSSNSTPTAKPTAGGRVTSKYLDISKYKSDRSNNFLKRDESKNYLNREVKKSSSSACLQNFQRDATRTSQRSASSRPSSATTIGGAKKKDAVKSIKEAELAMWKRRASYDPMKAAAEGKKKAEEAKKLVQQQQMMMSSESNSSAMRSSKSYHAGTGNSWINDDTDSDFDDEN